MGKRIIIAGATGMIGSLVLAQSLRSPKVSDVFILVRKETGQTHRKLKEIIIHDFEDYREHYGLFQDIDATIFCIGAYTGQINDETFKKITLDYAVRFAEALKLNSPKATLCLLSGRGADRTEKSSTSFAKYKGMAENQISDLQLGQFYTFRPSYIYPETPRKEPNLLYSISRTLYPFIQLLGENYSIKSGELANAMLQAALYGAKKEVLENKDILRLLDTTEIKTEGCTRELPYGALDYHIIIESRTANEKFLIRPEEFNYLAEHLFKNWQAGKSKYIQLLQEWNECTGFFNDEGTPSILSDLQDTIYAIQQVEGVERLVYGKMTHNDLALLIAFLEQNKHTELKVWKE